MSKTFYKVLIVTLLAFSFSQIVLVAKYEKLNQSLQDALAKCIGLEKVG